ncbi:MAG: outer membrane beta-barrel protein [SAR324 cluster bacterium]|nr:outer membrane beta-barrel protein [SAR324 cluster bacterium]
MKKTFFGICLLFLTAIYATPVMAADGGHEGWYAKVGTASDDDAANDSPSTLVYGAGYRFNHWFGLEYDMMAPRQYDYGTTTYTVNVSSFYAAFRWEITNNFDINYKWGKSAVTVNTDADSGNTTETNTYGSSGPGIEIFLGNFILFAEKIGVSTDGDGSSDTTIGLGYQF